MDAAARPPVEGGAEVTNPVISLIIFVGLGLLLYGLLLGSGFARWRRASSDLATTKASIPVLLGVVRLTRRLFFSRAGWGLILVAIVLVAVFAGGEPPGPETAVPE